MERNQLFANVEERGALGIGDVFAPTQGEDFAFTVENDATISGLDAKVVSRQGENLFLED